MASSPWCSSFSLPLLFSSPNKNAPSGEEGAFRKFIDERYGSFKSGIGASIMSGKSTLGDAEKWILAEGYPVLKSGRQEMLENLLNAYIE